MLLPFCFFFFFNDTATTEIYTLSLHDALPIFHLGSGHGKVAPLEQRASAISEGRNAMVHASRSEEHTSELQSRLHLVCRLLLEKKKNQIDHSLSHLAYPHVQNLFPLPRTATRL